MVLSMLSCQLSLHLHSLHCWHKKSFFRCTVKLCTRRGRNHLPKPDLRGYAQKRYLYDVRQGGVPILRKRQTGNDMRRKPIDAKIKKINMKTECVSKKSYITFDRKGWLDFPKGSTHPNHSERAL